MAQPLRSRRLCSKWRGDLPTASLGAVGTVRQVQHQYIRHAAHWARVVAAVYAARVSVVRPGRPLQLSAGAPLAYYTDETDVYATKQRVTLSVYPTPGPDQDGMPVYMRCIRLPLTHYSLDNLDVESDLLDDYQLDALEWAAYRAQRTFDGDAGAPTSAEAHKKRFEEAVMEAQQEVKRKIFTNIGIHYGMNGTSWVR